jgi:dCTP diphosphatase
MDNIIAKIVKFNQERDWEQFHSYKNLAGSIVIESAELLELFQWTKTAENGAVQKELADIFIYLFALCNKLGMDEDAIKQTILDKIYRNGERYPVEQYKGSCAKAKK